MLRNGNSRIGHRCTVSVSLRRNLTLAAGDFTITQRQLAGANFNARNRCCDRTAGKGRRTVASQIDCTARIRSSRGTNALNHGVCHRQGGRVRTDGTVDVNGAIKLTLIRTAIDFNVAIRPCGDHQRTHQFRALFSSIDRYLMAIFCAKHYSIGCRRCQYMPIQIHLNALVLQVDASRSTILQQSNRGIVTSRFIGGFQRRILYSIDFCDIGCRPTDAAQSQRHDQCQYGCQQFFHRFYPDFFRFPQEPSF